VIATSFALLAFIAAVVVGFAAGNELHTIVWRATIVMVWCWVIGRIVGAVAQRTVERHITRYKLEHPIPEDVSLEDLIARRQAEQGGGGGQASQDAPPSIAA